MLSRRGHYALRAMIILAGKGSDVPMRTPQIAAAGQLTSSKLLESVLVDLRKGGVLNSVRGRNGGFVLARAARDITFADIVHITDGSLALSPCLREDGYEPCADCFDEARCVLRRALAGARDVTTGILRSYDLARAAAPRL